MRYLLTINNIHLCTVLYIYFHCQSNHVYCIDISTLSYPPYLYPTLHLPCLSLSYTTVPNPTPPYPNSTIPPWIRRLWHPGVACGRLDGPAQAAPVLHRAHQPQPTGRLLRRHRGVDRRAQEGRLGKKKCVLCALRCLFELFYLYIFTIIMYNIVSVVIHKLYILILYFYKI